MKAFVLLSAILCAVTGVTAQLQTEDQAAGYTKAITQRAAKIVSPLQISDSAKASQVQAVIVQQYRNLSAIHDVPRDSSTEAQLKKSAQHVYLKAFGTAYAATGRPGKRRHDLWRIAGHLQRLPGYDPHAYR